MLPLLRNLERDYGALWGQTQPEAPFGEARIDFNDSASMLLAAESGMGVAVSRTSLVATAIQEGKLVQAFAGELMDGLDYYAVCTERAYQKPAVRMFTDWLAAEFDVAVD